jgi:hypothetical protein
MHVTGLLALLLSSSLSAAPTAKPTAAKPTAAKPKAAATEIALEVVEQGSGGASSFGFVVPIHGSIEAWIDRGEEPRRCEVEATLVREELMVELHCEGGPDRTLKVEATRSLAPGKRTRIAEVTRPGGTKRQVFVTLQ